MPVYQNKGGYLLVEVPEPYSLNLILEIIDEVARRRAAEGLRRVLVDLSNMHGNLDTLDRYTVGEATATVVGPQVKVAALARGEIIDGMAETVAVNRGANLKVFSDMSEAMEWLLAEP